MPWSSQAVVATEVIVEGGGVFTYDASGNLRSANVGQTVTDPNQGITCYAGFSTFNGHGAVISLFSSTLDAQFWYADTGTSAQGALIASVGSVASGTDPFGNGFIGEVATYLAGGGGSVTVAALVGSELDTYTAASAAGPFTIASRFTGAAWSASSGALQIRAGSGTFLQVNPALLVAATASAMTTSAMAEVQGTLAGDSFDYIPAGTAPPAAPSGVEPWNAMSLINGWANDAAGPNASYRLIGSPPRCVQLTGFLDSSASTSPQIATALPAAYRPTVTKRFKPVLVAGALPASEMFGSVNSAGQVQLFNIPTAAGDKVQIPEGTIYALDI